MKLKHLLVEALDDMSKPIAKRKHNRLQNYSQIKYSLDKSNNGSIIMTTPLRLEIIKNVLDIFEFQYQSVESNMRDLKVYVDYDKKYAIAYSEVTGMVKKYPISELLFIETQKENNYIN